MATVIPAVRQDRTLIVGYDSNMAAGKIHAEVSKAMKDLLSANDGFGNGTMREAILDRLNRLNRYIKEQFLMAGVTQQSDYYRDYASNDNGERA